MSKVSSGKAAPKKAADNKDALSKAKQTKKNLLNGAGKTKLKVYHKPQFRLPKTLILPRNPKCPTKAIHKRNLGLSSDIILGFVKSDASIGKLKRDNTISLFCNVKSNKCQIKRAFEDLFGIKPLKVNTLICPDGLKKAYIRLDRDQDAEEVAARYGFPK